MIRWNPYEAPTDTFRIAPLAHKSKGAPTKWTQSPGLSDVTAATSKRRWDAIGAFGMSGGTLLFRGYELCPFTITIRLYTEFHWDHWHAFKLLLDRADDHRIERFRYPRLLWIEHPLLAELQIRAGALESMEAPLPLDGEPGAWLITTRWLEHRPLTAATAKVPQKAPAPLDPEDARNQQLLDEGNALEAKRDALISSQVQQLAPNSSQP